MNFAQYIPYLIIILTAITSVMAFSNRDLTNKLIFNVGAVLRDKQWYRMLTSAFLHGDWMHLIFNMLTLYFFSGVIVSAFGAWRYLIIYFGSVICGSLLSLFMHRKEPYYLALGASGGVVGILFAAIALAPTMQIGILFIPGRIPAWLFGILYLGYSVYAMRQNADNVGHDAHLGGAATGVLLTILFAPAVLQEHGLYIGLMSIPLVILAVLMWKQK